MFHCLWSASGLGFPDPVRNHFGKDHREFHEAGVFSLVMWQSRTLFPMISGIPGLRKVFFDLAFISRMVPSLAQTVTATSARLFHPFKVKLILPPSLAELVVGVRIRIDIKVVDWEPPVCANDARG